MRRFLHISLTVFIIHILFVNRINAQESYCRIFVKNIAQKDIIQIKWFFKDIYLNTGVNIYRKDTSERTWVKLNDAPLKMGDYLPLESYTADSVLPTLVDWVIKLPKQDIKGIALITVYLKAIQNNRFARFLGNFYSDSLVHNGKTYQYKITSAGLKESELACSEYITAGEIYRLSPPQEIQISSGKQMVSISWKPEEERYFGVNVYRYEGNNSVKKKLNIVPVIISRYKDKNEKMVYPQVFFTDNNLKNDSTYYYTLKALDFFGDEGEESMSFKAVPQNSEPPKPPQNLEIKQERNNIRLKWRFNSGDDQVNGFKIYRGVKSDSLKCITSALLSVEINEFVDTIDKPGGYYYYVSSVNKYGIEGKSNKVFVEVRDYLAPAKPTGVKISCDTGKIIISWSPNTEPDLLGYLIFRRPANAKYREFSQFTPDVINKCRFINIMPKKVSNAFIYRIVAVDTSLNRSEPSQEVVAKLPDVTPPAKPCIKNISETEKGIMIEWSPNVESDLYRYEILRTNISDSIKTTTIINEKEIPSSISKFYDVSAERGIEYIYNLIAFDSVGNKSQLSDSYTFMKTPEPPKIAGAERIKINYNPQQKAVSISWKIKEKDFLGTVIYRKDSTQNTFKALTGLIKENFYKDDAIDFGKDYMYQLRIYYATGEQWKSKMLNVKTKRKD